MVDRGKGSCYGKRRERWYRIQDVDPLAYGNKKDQKEENDSLFKIHGMLTLLITKTDATLQSEIL